MIDLDCDPSHQFPIYQFPIYLAISGGKVYLSRIASHYLMELPKLPKGLRKLVPN